MEIIVAIKIVDVEIISLIESEAVASKGKELIIFPIFFGDIYSYIAKPKIIGGRCNGEIMGKLLDNWKGRRLLIL